MRPEISRVVREIYPELKDDQSVMKIDDVRGVNGKNYFFFNHDFLED